MKKIAYVLLILLISCRSEKENKDIIDDAYYFNNKISQIFHFNKNKMVQYIFIDSSFVSYNLKLNENFIFINNLKYSYKNFNNDSITIYNYFENENNLNLIKFDFKNFDVSELNESNWSLNLNDRNGNKKNQFFKIQGEKGMHFFERFEDDTIHFQKIPFVGKFFNKFNIYSLNSFNILGGYTKNNLVLLNMIDYRDPITEIYTLKRIISKKKINPLLIGKWYKTRKKNLFNSRAYLKYTYKIDDNDKDFERKIDSVEMLLDYSKIEFTNNQKLIRYLNKGQIRVEYDVNNAPVSKYIFVNNPDFYTQYFEIKKVTKDSLTIEISEPHFRYNYVRDSIDNDLK